MEDAIASVFRQTALPEELIVIDDASDDDTIERIERLQGIYPTGWLKLIAQPENQGPASARNRGWDMASGSYIAFLDADDLWHPRKIEVQYARFRNDPELRLTCVASRHLGADYPQEFGSYLDYDVKPVSFGSQLFRNQFVTSGVMLDRDLPNRFIEGRSFSEDALLWSTIAGQGHKSEVCLIPLAIYRKARFDGGGLSANQIAMYNGQKENHRLLHSMGLISRKRRMLLDKWSFIRYVVRRFRHFSHQISAAFQGAARG